MHFFKNSQINALSPKLSYIGRNTSEALPHVRKTVKMERFPWAKKKKTTIPVDREIDQFSRNKVPILKCGDTYGILIHFLWGFFKGFRTKCSILKLTL